MSTPASNATTIRNNPPETRGSTIFGVVGPLLAFLVDWRTGVVGTVGVVETVAVAVAVGLFDTVGVGTATMVMPVT